MAATIRFQMPAWRQRRNRLASVDQGLCAPAHPAPVRTRHKMPLRTRRWSSVGRPTLGRWGGSTGASRSHWSSLRSPQFVIPHATGSDACLHTRPKRCVEACRVSCYAPLVEVVSLDELLAVVDAVLLPLLFGEVLVGLAVPNSEVAAFVDALVLPVPDVAIGNCCSMTST